MVQVNQWTQVLDAFSLTFGGESIIQWPIDSLWKEKSSKSEKARAVYFFFKLLGWWSSHVSVLWSTHHRIKPFWLCRSDVLLCPTSSCIFGPRAGLALVHLKSLSILFS